MYESVRAFLEALHEVIVIMAIFQRSERAYDSILDKIPQSSQITEGISLSRFQASFHCGQHYIMLRI
jgi:hypothetical protein